MKEKMMKHRYQSPKIGVICVDTKDVLTLSLESNDNVKNAITFNREFDFEFEGV